MNQSILWENNNARYWILLNARKLVVAGMQVRYCCTYFHCHCKYDSVIRSHFNGNWSFALAAPEWISMAVFRFRVAYQVPNFDMSARIHQRVRSIPAAEHSPVLRHLPRGLRVLPHGSLPRRPHQNAAAVLRVLVFQRTRPNFFAASRLAPETGRSWIREDLSAGSMAEASETVAYREAALDSNRAQHSLGSIRLVCSRLC